MFQKQPDMHTDLIRSENGFSLMDLIVGLSIITIAFTVFFVSSTNISSAESRGEVIIEATNIANNVMETIRGKRFDENQAPPYSTALGKEESGSIFDDIDDYANHVWQGTGYNYGNYFIRSRVFYVNSEASWDDSVGTPTTLKRIIVEVNHSSLSSPIILNSLMGVR